MNVLVVMDKKYPDKEAVRQRLEAGTAKPEHTTYVLKHNHTLKAMLTGMGARFEVFRSPEEYDYLQSGDGYLNMALNFADAVIVYSCGSATSEYFIKKKEHLPVSYDRKVQVIAAPKKRVKRTKKARRAE